MQGADANTEKFRNSFRIEQASSLLIRTLKNAEITVTECQSGAADGELSAPFPEDDAYIVGLMLKDYPDCHNWEQGRYVSRISHLRGQTHIYDVKRDPRFRIDHPIHVLMFYLPRTGFDTISAEARMPRMGEINYKPGVGYDDVVVRHLGHVMLEALKLPEQASRFFVDHVTLALTSHVAQTYGELGNPMRPIRGGLAAWQKRRACELLDAHLAGGITLSDLAAACGLSTSHFVRAFRQSAGITPHAWLIRRRIDRAMTLMRMTAEPLSTIAQTAGFADQSHFTRVFSKVTGVSPGNWRRNAACVNPDGDE
jgi:AraC-like DNA-binding protein